MDKSIPIETNPLETLRPGSVDDAHNQTENTSSPAPLMVAPSDDVNIETHNTATLPPPLVATPVSTVTPLTSSEGVSVEAHYGTATPLPPPLMATPVVTVTPLTSSEVVNDEVHYGTATPLPSLMATPVVTVRPLTSCEGVNDEAHYGTATPLPPPLMATPVVTVRPLTSSEGVTKETHNTATPLPAPLMATPLVTVTPLTSSEGVTNLTHNTATPLPPPLMATPVSTVRPLTSCEGVNDEVHYGTATPLPPPLMASCEGVNDEAHYGTATPLPPPLMASCEGANDEAHYGTATPLPPPLMATPVSTVTPLTSSEGVSVEAHYGTATPLPPPLMATPVSTVRPLTSCEGVNDEAHYGTATPLPPPLMASCEGVNDEAHYGTATPLPPPLMATPVSTVTPLTSSEGVSVEAHYGTATPLPPPLMATPVSTVRPLTSCEGVNDEAHYGTATPLPPPLMATPVATVRPLISSEGVTKETHNTATPLPPPLMATPLVTVTPLTSSEGVTNLTHNTATHLPPPLMATPLRTIKPCEDTSNSTFYDVGAGSSTGPIKRGRGRPKGSKNKNPKSTTKKAKTYDPNSRMVTSCPNFNSGISEEERENGNQEIVDLVLMRFEAVRRRLSQLCVKPLLTTASSNCMNLGVRTNMKKRIGNVPGIQVGHIFYFWGEMCLVGLHTQTVAGIDYLKDATDGRPLATSVVTSGHYDDESYEFDTLIYTGHGGTEKNGAARDQKLERGNLALEESRKKANEVRVIRGLEDPSDNKKKIYVYDGLYTVTEHWKAKGKSGFDEFKFKLVRKPGQPCGYATWKLVENWNKCGLSNSREGVIIKDLSIGMETLPVPVVNEVDTNVPENFNYTRSLVYSSMVLDLKTDRPTIGCNSCRGRSCFTEDANCVCVRKNDGELPYHNRLLVCRRGSVYECGSSCPCVPDCSNRVVQRGLKIRVEVFKTEKCGWGLRSWEPIRAGTFICEFAGLSRTKEEVEEDDDYVFDSSRVYYNWYKWNYEPELVGDDPWEQVSEVFNLPSQVLISAKRHGNVGRFINHSCSPNVLWQPVGYELNGESYFRIGFFAMKHIPPLTELRYDYGVSRQTEEIGEDGKPLFKGKEVCLCGSLNCRGSFG